MNFNDLVKRLLNEMAVEKESDVVYLSQLLNQPRYTGSQDDFDITNQFYSFRYITSKTYSKHLYKKFAPSVKYPIRLIIDDIQYLTKHRASRADISNLIAPIPGIITFVWSENLGIAGLPTPFMVAHNVGHVIQSITRYNEYTGRSYYQSRGGYKTDEYKLKTDEWGVVADEHGYYNALESVIGHTVVDIARSNPDQPWFTFSLSDTNTREEEYFEDADLFDNNEKFWDGAWMEILTPNIYNITEGGMDEYAPNIVASYMKYGRINFRVGSARKIEEFIDKQLQSFVGKTIALS